MRIVAVAAQRAFAESLLDAAVPGGGGDVDGDTPPTSEVLADAHYS